MKIIAVDLGYDLTVGGRPLCAHAELSNPDATERSLEAAHAYDEARLAVLRAQGAHEARKHDTQIAWVSYSSPEADTCDVDQEVWDAVQTRIRVADDFIARGKFGAVYHDDDGCIGYATLSDAAASATKVGGYIAPKIYVMGECVDGLE